MNINEYKELFEKEHKEELFNLNKDFIEELCNTKERINELRMLINKDNKPKIHINSLNGRIEVSDAEYYLIKLQDHYKNLVVVFNKIFANVFAEKDDDPIGDFENVINQLRERNN